MCWRQVGIYHWEQLDGSKLGGVSLTVHESLDHLNNLLLQIFHINQGENVFDTFNSLYKEK